MTAKPNYTETETDPLFDPEEKIWDEFRSLIVGDEKVQLDRLQRFLEDPEELSKEIARRLPRAFELNKRSSGEITNSLVESVRPVLEKALQASSEIDPSPLSEGLYKALPNSINLSRSRNPELTEQLIEAIRPVVEQAIRQSAELSIKPLSEGLYPVIGPAIRKAVADAFKKMNQTLNHSFERTFSVAAFKWRIQALTTGRPFIDIVAQNTLVFQVKQVYLIHSETGLLLQSVESHGGSSQDPDMVSAMLKAIQDFVRDSFSVKQDEELSTIEVGEHTIWVEQGPKAILAGVVSGSAPMTLRSVFGKALEKTHIDFARELESFDGDTTVFEANTQHIEYCLQQQEKSEQKKPALAKWLIFVVILGAASYWGVTQFLENNRWNNYLSSLSKQPGIIITAEGKKGGRHFIRGLRTPDSMKPESVLVDYKFDPQKINSTWNLYQPLSNDYLLERANRLLKPPDSVQLKLQDGELHISGTASKKWFDSVKTRVEFIWEIKSVDLSKAQVAELNRIEILKKKIMLVQIAFDSGQTNLTGENLQKVNTLSTMMRELQNLADQSNKYLNIEVHGFSDPTGNPTVNQRLSISRAQSVKGLLIRSGFQSERISTFGDITKVEDAKADSSSGRSVKLIVELKKL